MEPAGRTVIRAEALTKNYGSTVALDALDLEIEQGEVFGYLGPNGAGKSTTIALLLGLIRPTSGSARIFGLDARGDAVVIHRRLAYVPSEANLWPSLTGEESLRFLGAVHGTVDDAYRDELVERFELDPEKKVRAYSHGNRQKVLLIAALASRPDLLLLDEPTTGLDPLMEQVFRACVLEAKDRGQTVLLSSHILSEVESLCDRVAMLRAGRVIEQGHLDVLRGLAALRVRADVEGPVPDLTGVEGVTRVVVDGSTVECEVIGSMEPLVRALAAAGVRRMTTREPSLEEVFVSHYGETANAGRRFMKTSVAIATAPPAEATVPARPAEPAIARRAFRQLWIGASACALIFGATVASSAVSYVSSFPTEASRQQLLTVTSGNSGLAVLLGPLDAVDTVGGYTFYKSWVTLTAVGAIWALLAATKLLRGEEEAGRWALVLSGGTRAARATGASLAALAAAVGVILVGTTALTILAGNRPGVGFSIGDSVLLALSLTIAPAVFAAVGACTSQIGGTRRLATGLGMVVFGVSFALRMLGDSGASQHWVLWLTPLGWTDLVRPFTWNDTRPLVLAAVFVVALGATAVSLASRRDVGHGLVATRETSELRPFGLGSPIGLAARLELPVLSAWVAGAAASGFALGLIAKMTTTSVPDSLNDVLAKFGLHSDFTSQYLGVAFLLVATVVALVPANQIGAASADETSGRLIHVLAGPTRRTAWLVGRLVLAAAAVVVAGLVAGLGTWIGAASAGVDLGLGSMLEAGLNVVRTALLALGFGALVFALAPRAAAGAVYALVAWSLVVDLLGSLVSGLGWLENLTLFHAMALVPAEDPHPATIEVTLALAVLACGIAVVVFARRDLHTR